MNDRNKQPDGMLEETGVHLHLAGIGGSGMRGLARLLQARNCVITGCDTNRKQARKLSGELGVDVFAGHDQNHLTGPASEAPDYLIYSAALDEDHVERKAARNRDLPTVRYGDALARLFNLKKGVAVAGTHGKTTCSALLSVVLEEAGLDPSCLVGGELKQWRSNARPGNGPHFVAEACEYGGNFQNMTPAHILLTNIDRDHLDYFNGENEIQETFASFVSTMEPTGFLVTPAEGAGTDPITDAVAGKVQTVSEKDENPWLLRRSGDGSTGPITVQSKGDQSPPLPVPVPGEHQAMNTALVAVMARLLGAEWDDVQNALTGFAGIRRRFDVVKQENPVVVDDYGHHPAEVAATINAAREAYPDHEITVCFQPHQFSRTRDFLGEWADALQEADRIWLLPIYEARDDEETKNSVSIRDVADELTELDTPVRVLNGPEETGRRIRDDDSPERRLYLTLGAGDIWKAVEEFRLETSHL